MEQQKHKEPSLFRRDWDLTAGVTGTEEGYDSKVIKLKPRHYKAISLLLQGFSYTDVANTVGVSKRTVDRWFANGTICHEILSNRRYAIWNANRQQAVNLYSDAILEMSMLLHSEKESIRLRAASFVLGNLTPEKPANMEELSEVERRKLSELRGFPNYTPYYKKSKIYGEKTEYAIDTEDTIQDGELDYPEDFPGECSIKPLKEEYTKIKLSLDEIAEIIARLNEAEVSTEEYKDGYVIRDRDGYVVGELQSGDSSRPSYARNDDMYRSYYEPYMSEFFSRHKYVRVTDRHRHALGITQTSDIEGIINLFIGLGNVTVPARYGYDNDTESEQEITAGSYAENICV